MHSFPKLFKHRLISEPIPIGNCHTVSGHEAMDLAKRLSEELAAQQSGQQKQSSSLDNNEGNNRVCSPEGGDSHTSRSFDQQGHAKKGIFQGILTVYCYRPGGFDSLRVS